MPNLPKKPAKEQLEQDVRHAMCPRTQDGLIAPIIPVGPGPAADMVGQLYFPAVKLSQAGSVKPIMFARDFAGGELPEYMEYAPGFERPDRPYDGKALDGIVYNDPIRNLPPDQYALLWRAKNLPSMSQQPQPEEYDPSALMMPPSVRSTPYGMVAETKSGDELLSNFKICAVERRIIKKRGQPDQEELLLKVTPRGSDCHFLTVDAANLSAVVSIVSKHFPECHLNEDSAKASVRIANAVRDQISGLPVITVIKSPGFVRLGGCWVYAHDGAIFNGPVKFSTGCTIPHTAKITEQEALKAALGILELAESSTVTLPLLLLSYQGFMFNLFEAAGVTPKAPAFLNGQTGSFKTATTQALFRPFAELPATPEASFRDTPTALEVKIGEACSRTIVIDDYQPAVTSAAGRENLEKLEHVVRLYGDGIGKSRSNAELGKAREFKPAGCCLITGEDTGGSHSTLLRCLVLPLKKGEISGQRLKFYQDHPDYLRTHWFHFLTWAGVNGDKIVAWIRDGFQYEREQFAAAIHEPRQIDIGAFFMVTARILLEYMRVTLSLDDALIDATRKQWRATLIDCIRQSEESSAELDPVRMYLEAILNGLDTGKISVAPTQAEFKRGYHFGFWKDGNLWLFHQNAYTCATCYWKNEGIVFPLKPSNTHARLAQAGLIETAQEMRKGKPKVLYLVKSTLERRPRLLVLRVEQARSYIENN